MRIVHYLNQFFGGMGGEEKAAAPLQTRLGAVGPGRLFEQVFRGEAEVVMTLLCGDNYAVENQEGMIAAAIDKIREAKADLVIAGPCFQAGRYGMAAGALCSAVQAELAIPALAAMAEENPGTDLYREKLYIIDSGTDAAQMRHVMSRMAALARKLVNKNPIGLPREEGYFARGFIRDQFVEKTAAERLVDMVLAKVRGEPFDSEMTPTAFAPVPLAPAVKDLSRAKLLLITDGGLVPKGNPDKIQGSAATRWGSYKIDDCVDLKGDDYEVSHGGYDPQFVRQDPDRLVPVDVMRELERDGVIGKLHEEFFSTSGLANPLSKYSSHGPRDGGQGKTIGSRCGHFNFDLRHEHAQRCCDRNGVGEGGHSNGADYIGDAHCQNGRRQSSGPRQRNRARPR